MTSPTTIETRHIEMTSRELATFSERIGDLVNTLSSLWWIDLMATIQTEREALYGRVDGPADAFKPKKPAERDEIAKLVHDRFGSTLERLSDENVMSIEPLSPNDLHDAAFGIARHVGYELNRIRLALWLFMPPKKP